MAKFRSKTTFNVGAVAGVYASERVTFDAVNSGYSPPELDAVTVLSVLGNTPATGAVVELWLPQIQPSTRPVPDAEYSFFAALVTGNGGFTQPLATWKGAQIRVKSGGAAGTVDVHATAD